MMMCSVAKTLNLHVFTLATIMSLRPEVGVMHGTEVLIK